MICAFTPVQVLGNPGIDADARTLEREHELEAFSHAVAHDLRAPLRVLHGYLDLLEEELQDGSLDAARNCLHRSRESVCRMQLMIAKLLQLPHLHRIHVPRERVDLGAMATQLIDEFRATEPARRVHLEVHPSLTVEADPVLSRILLQNLLGNAWKYTKRQPAAQIVMGSSTKEGLHAFFVADNGVGFAPAAADRLFRPFQRLHSASDFEGTGIGLVAVRRIVDCHGGRIWAEGRPGHGATFFFTLQQEDRPRTGHGPVTADGQVS